MKRTEWVTSPVDSFVLAKLEASGLSPAPPADKRTLIRRVTFDLTGLPPTPAEVDAFVNDTSANAFARLVDRLLDSPHYGERWARHWLDLVRYAETNGHEFDNNKFEPWRYRDYVIRSFNHDVPYDRFVREHVAGDLLAAKRYSPDGASLESPLATAYLWFGEVLNSTTDSVKARADQVDNQIDVTGKAFLGLTVACARCHNHKFDPIPTADYYSLAGVFHSTDLREDVVDSPRLRAEIHELSRGIREIDNRIAALAPSTRLAPVRVLYRPEDEVFANFENGGFGKWVTAGEAFSERPEVGMASSLAAGSDRFVGTLTSPKFRTGKKRYLHVRVSGTKSDPKWKENGDLRFTMVTDGYKGQHIVPDGSEKPVWKTLTLTLEREREVYFEIVDRSRDGHIAVDKIVFSDLKDPPPIETLTDAGFRSQPDGTTTSITPAVTELVRKRGELEAAIPPSAFAMLAADYQPHNVRIHIRGNHTSLGEEVPRRFLQVIATADQPIAEGSGRAQIANWLTSPRNPLTARVMVNRIWKHHFGQGIVKSVDNFGAMGDRPTNPELLDYLAGRFIESGWSIKAMHRLMVLSSAYQMSSLADATAATRDPENKFLSHMPVQRLEAEAIRDSMLAIAGTLDRKMFGPSVPPHISAYQDGRGKPESGPLDGARRRTIYIQVRRNFLTPLLLAFDYPLPISAIGARGVSIVPSQALLLMNNEFVAQQAREFAKRALAAPLKDRVNWMYQAAFSREPDGAETDQILHFVSAQPELYKSQGSSPPANVEEQVWSDVAQVMFSSPEFLFVR